MCFGRRTESSISKRNASQCFLRAHNNHEHWPFAVFVGAERTGNASDVGLIWLYSQIWTPWLLWRQLANSSISVLVPVTHDILCWEWGCLSNQRCNWRAGSPFRGWPDREVSYLGLGFFIYPKRMNQNLVTWIGKQYWKNLNRKFRRSNGKQKRNGPNAGRGWYPCRQRRWFQ